MIPAESSEPADRRFDKVLELGRAIQACVRRADLEGAGDVAAQRQACLHSLFADPDLDRGDEMVVYWLQQVLREDRELMDGLEALRQRMQTELGSLRNSSRSAQEYAEVERG